jgi:NitT/TauT family transport system substrate-binding protein
MKSKFILAGAAALLALGAAHVWINVGFDNFARDVHEMFGAKHDQLVVGFLPVTCHLTCPVVDWTTRHSDSGSEFKSQRYSEFPTMCEDLAQGTLSAAFLNTPLAVSLVQKGVGVKIVSLGHRDGSGIMVRADSKITSFAQLAGKKILIPSRFSNQQLWLARLCKANHMELSSLNMVTAGPPEMPALLETGQCDAYVVGEPFCARSEMVGTARMLLQVKDSWPNFISCALVVRDEVIAEHRELIQELVDGINGSGLWLEQGVDNRFSAADVVANHYYNQKPELLKYVLSKPIDRVRYDQLTPLKKDFDEIMALGLEVGMFKEFVPFESYVDPSFSAKVPNVAVPMPPDDGSDIQVAIAPSKPAPAAAPAPAKDAGTTKK